MPEPLRNGLWNACLGTYFNQIYSHYGAKAYSDTTRLIWLHHYVEPTDLIPDIPSKSLKIIRSRFFEYDFIGVYAFLEFISSLDPQGYTDKGKTFRSMCNNALSRERAAFRFAGQYLIRITNEAERSEVERGLNQRAEPTVAEHIAAAARLYSSRDTPDYRNSIKESISAVESAVFRIQGKKSSGIDQALKEIGTRHGLHPAFVAGVAKLYGYTSDKDGIRHAMMEVPEVKQEDARFMLIACSALSNYLLSLELSKK